MNFNEEFPEYSAIARHIRRANAESSFYVANSFASVVVATLRFVKQLLPARRLQQREA